MIRKTAPEPEICSGPSDAQRVSLHCRVAFCNVIPVHPSSNRQKIVSESRCMVPTMLR